MQWPKRKLFRQDRGRVTPLPKKPSPPPPPSPKPLRGRRSEMEKAEKILKEVKHAQVIRELRGIKFWILAIWITIICFMIGAVFKGTSHGAYNTEEIPDCSDVYDINDAGDIVGIDETWPTYFFEIVGHRYLLPLEYESFIPRFINNIGEVGGNWYDKNSAYYTCSIWNPRDHSLGMKHLGPPVGDPVWYGCDLRDMNDEYMMVQWRGIDHEYRDIRKGFRINIVTGEVEEGFSYYMFAISPDNKYMAGSGGSRSFTLKTEGIEEIETIPLPGIFIEEINGHELRIWYEMNGVIGVNDHKEVVGNAYRVENGGGYIEAGWHWSEETGFTIWDSDVMGDDWGMMRDQSNYGFIMDTADYRAVAINNRGDIVAYESSSTLGPVIFQNVPDEPPVEEPPVEEPPVEAPQEEPLIEQPPEEVPQEEPPVEQPPEEVPQEEPPVEEPPVEEQLPPEPKAVEPIPLPPPAPGSVATPQVMQSSGGGGGCFISTLFYSHPYKWVVYWNDDPVKIIGMKEIGGAYWYKIKVIRTGAIVFVPKSNLEWKRERAS